MLEFWHNRTPDTTTADSIAGLQNWTRLCAGFKSVGPCRVCWNSSSYAGEMGVNFFSLHEYTNELVREHRIDILVGLDLNVLTSRTTLPHSCSCACQVRQVNQRTKTMSLSTLTVCACINLLTQACVIILFASTWVLPTSMLMQKKTNIERSTTKDLRFIEYTSLSTFKHNHRQLPSNTCALSYVQAGSMKFGPPPCPFLRMSSMTSGSSPCPEKYVTRIGEQVLYFKIRGHVATRSWRHDSGSFCHSNFKARKSARSLLSLRKKCLDV